MWTHKTLKAHFGSQCPGCFGIRALYGCIWKIPVCSLICLFFFFFFDLHAPQSSSLRKWQHVSRAARLARFSRMWTENREAASYSHKADSWKGHEGEKKDISLAIAEIHRFFWGFFFPTKRYQFIVSHTAVSFRFVWVEFSSLVADFSCN